MATTPTNMGRWLQRKRYQFEVTFGLYMLDPPERFVVYSIVFLLTSMILIAAFLYMPEHVSIIAGRASFYWHGDGASPGAKVMRWYRAGRRAGAHDLAAAATHAVADGLADTKTAKLAESLVETLAAAAAAATASLGAAGGEL